MGGKFDKQRTKHQLYHVSISLGAILICMLYIQTIKSWINIGKLWESFVIPIILIGEISKLLLAKYFGHKEKDIIIQKQKRKNQYVSKLIKDLFKAFFLQTLCTIFYAFTCIILGAPVLHNYEQTFALAILLTLLTVSPMVFLFGTNGTLQVVFCDKNDFLNKIEENCLELFKYNAAGAIFGAWAGSIVVPLDWDREWQTYPIPNIIGALFGCGIANIFACLKVLINVSRVYLNKKRL